MAPQARRPIRPRGSEGHPARYKRASTLVCYYRDGRFHCRNYLRDEEIESSAVVVDVLSALNDWTTLDELGARLSSFTARSVRRALRDLVTHALVVVEGSALARVERATDAWRQWGEPASFFHFGTKRAFRRRPVKNEVRFNRERLRQRPLPPVVKPYVGAPTITLARPSHNADQPFPSLLLRRRTYRAFGRKRITLAQLASLLYYSFGFTASKTWPGLGEVPLRTSPSGGARQPLEAYCVALGVTGLARGVYHYRPDTHVLELVRPDVTAARVADWCGHQTWIAGAAAIVFLSAVLPRILWRYDSARAYRVLLLETGHFGQTFCLTATWLGLLPFQTAALDDERIERFLGLDGGSEAVMYALGVGAALPSTP